MNRPIRILHLISTTDVGGAEMSLARLVAGLDRGHFESLVISMTTLGPIGLEIQNTGIRVEALGMLKGLPDPRGIVRLARIVQQFKPDIIQGWMYHANLLSLLFRRGRKVFWNIRCSDMDLNQYGPIYSWTVKAGARLSGKPDLVIANSKAGRKWHEKLGYHPNKWEVIPNGIDTDIFKPDHDAGKQIRQELGIPQDARVIGLIARFDPMKDHATFFKAAAILQNDLPDVHFILAGRGVDQANRSIQEMMAVFSKPEQVHQLGERADIPAVLNALDIACLSSISEGLPNALAEAMSCGVPCVSTTVGDAAAIIADTGLTVPPVEPQDLAAALKELCNLDRANRQELGRQARQRIIENYSLERFIQSYAALYQNHADLRP